MTELLTLAHGSAGRLEAGKGDGSGRMIYYTDRSGVSRSRRCNFDEFEVLMSTVEQSGEAGVRSFFDGAEVVDLSGMDREFDAVDLRAAAERCVDLSGYVDDEKVAAFACERGMGYTQARTIVSGALSGSTKSTAEEQNMAKIRGYAHQMGLNFSEAATQLSEQGVDLSTGQSGPGDPGEVTLSSVDDGPDHEAIRSRMERTGESYVDAATALAGEL